MEFEDVVKIVGIAIIVVAGIWLLGTLISILF